MTAQPERRGAPAEPSKLADRRKRAVKRPAVARDAAREGFTIITGLSGASPVVTISGRYFWIMKGSR